MDLPENLMNKLVKGFVILFIIYLISMIIVTYFGMMRSSPLLINKIVSTQEQQVINSSRLPLSDVGEGISWTFVNWLYIEDWTYRFGQRKGILSWGDNLLVYFDEKTNHLHVDIQTVPLGEVETLIYKDIPIQRWFSMIIILDNRTLDLFIDGELVASRMLKYLPSYNQNDLILFPNGGFRGKYGYLQYMSYKMPQFGINHFQALEKKFNGKSPIYRLYNGFFFAMVFGFKSNFHRGLIAGNRGLKKLNQFSIGGVGHILGGFFTSMGFIYELANRLIFMWA